MLAQAWGARHGCATAGQPGTTVGHCNCACCAAAAAARSDGAMRVRRPCGALGTLRLRVVRTMAARTAPTRINATTALPRMCA